MEFKLKMGCLAILATSSLNAQAIERHYSFNADFSSSNWNLILTRDGLEPFIDLRPYINSQDPASQFVMANQNVSGRFAYNTDSPVIRSTITPTVNHTLYNSLSSNFSFNLNSISGANQQFSIEGNNSSRQSSIYSFSHPTSGKQSFSTLGFGLTPNISLTSNCFNERDCSVNGYYYLNISTNEPIDFNESLADRFPDIFGDVSSFDLEVNSNRLGLNIAPEFNLKANSMYLGVSYEGTENLPTDGSLPNNLPDLTEATYKKFKLGFDNENNYNPVDLRFSSIEYTDGTQLIEGDPGYQDKYQQIEEFFFAANITSRIGIDYTLTNLSLIADGLSPETPLLPNNEASAEEGFEFTFETSNENEFTFIDPDVAIGYDYEVDSGSTFVSILLPEDIGDNLYELWLFDDVLGEFVATGEELTGGVEYLFTQDDLSLFRILGIETDEFIDPNDPFSFITGLKFADLGATVNVSQKAISEFVPAPVPVPPSLLLFVSGLMGLLVKHRKS